MSVIPANAGIQTSYTYSGDSRRTSSNVGGNVVKYIYDGMTPLIERDASNATQAVYTRNPLSLGGIGGLISSIAPALPAAGHIPEVALGRGRVSSVIFNTYCYHDSNLGNVNQITDSSGAVVQTYDYDAFGNIVNQTGSLTQAYQYKTKEYSPETGLVFFGARYYNPLIGRFITKDPMGMVDGPNQYIYCWNDPVNKIDPWGLKCGESWWTRYQRIYKELLAGLYGKDIEWADALGLWGIASLAGNLASSGYTNLADALAKDQISNAKISGAMTKGDILEKMLAANKGAEIAERTAALRGNKIR